MLALIAGGLAEARTGRGRLIWAGSVGVALSLCLLVAGGVVGSRPLFLVGLCVLGLSTGIATVSNLALMLDRTAAGSTGLYMGAWGMAEALARMGGNVLGGGLRDMITVASGNPLAGYGIVFGLQAALAAGSLALLTRTQGGLLWKAR